MSRIRGDRSDRKHRPYVDACMMLALRLVCPLPFISKQARDACCMRAMDPCLDGLVAVAEILEGFGVIPDVQDKLLDVNQDIKQGFDCLRPRCAGRRLSKFTNVHHRMEFARCQKLIKSIRKASARTSDKLRSLGVVWNQKMGLRYGDQHPDPPRVPQ